MTEVVSESAELAESPRRAGDNHHHHHHHHHRHFLSGLNSKKNYCKDRCSGGEIMTRKGNVIKVKQFRSSGGTSMSSACSWTPTADNGAPASLFRCRYSGRARRPI